MTVFAPSPADEFHHRDGPPPVAPPEPPPAAPPTKAPPAFTPPLAPPPKIRTPPAKPVLPTVTGPPVQPLTKLGYWGSIHDFNNAVQTMHDYYTKFEGGPPDKATMLSAALQHDQEQKNGPPQTELTKQALQSDNTRIIRHDGYSEPNTPMRQFIYGRDQWSDEHPNPTLPIDLQKFQTLQKQHPWVQAGMLPLPSALRDAVSNSFKIINMNNPAAVPLIEGGENIQQYEQQQKVAAQAIIGGTPSNPAELSMTGNNPQDIAATAAARKALDVGSAVTNNVEAQNRLKAIDPEFFGTLPSTGIFNQDWATAIKKYMTTPLYFRQVTNQQASDNGMSPGAFTKAWANKQQALQKNPLLHNLIMATPLFVYDHSGNWSEANYFTGNAKGTGWLDLPAIAVHTISSAASMAFGVVGGAIDQGVADANALTKYIVDISPKGTYWFWTEGGGKSERQAREDALKVAQEDHPGIINLADPNYGGPPVPDGKGGYKTKGGVLELVAQAAFDILISAPKFTGEYLFSGQSALTSRYFNAKTKFFYDAIKSGHPGALADAVDSLEGGDGAKKLAAFLEPGIQDGTVSLQDVRKYTNDLFMHGRTQIPVAGTKVVKAAPVVGQEAAAKELEAAQAEERLAVTPEQHEQAGARLTAAERVAALPKSAVEAPRMYTISGAQDGGALLRSLRTRGLPTPGRAGLKAEEMRAAIAKRADAFESALQADNSKFSGITNHAGTFVSHIRQLGARAEPNNDLRAVADERLPEDVYNWAVSKDVADKEQARLWQDQTIRNQAFHNPLAQIGLHNEMRDAFNAVHPGVELRAPIKLEEPGVLESEQKSYLYFPAALDTRAAKIQKGLNQASRVEREFIVFGPYAPSIGWKHAVDDSARRVLGGGGLGPRGTEGMDETVKSVRAFLTENPDKIRDLGVARAATEIGEQRYITEAGVSEDPKTFNTGGLTDQGKPIFEDASMMRAAGRYLRHNLSSNALRAYQRSTPENLGALKTYLLQSSEFRTIMFAQPDYEKKLSEIREAFRPPEGQLLLDREAWGSARDSNIHTLQDDTAQTYAELLFKRYKEIEWVSRKAGVQDPLNEALGVLIDNLGSNSDVALGNWLKEKKIELPIRQGLVQESRWDDWMTRGIKLLMTPNRWNRRVMFDHIFYGTVGDLTKAGWKMEDAMPVAADLAKFQTIYHMLDFANMLKVEKDYRYLAWFLTKRRLYWTWIAKMVKQRPGLALAVADIRSHLDSKGNLPLGYGLSLPVSKLFWLNETGQPETSTLAQYGGNVIGDLFKGQGSASFGNAVGALTATSGNLFTRADQTIQMAVKLGLIHAGIESATSDSVTAGMGSTQKLYFQEEVNKYSVFYHQQHGVWPSEKTAVQAALLYSMGQDFWRNYQPLPVNWNDPTVTPPKVQNLLNEYHRIVDPLKARKFLDQHPDVAIRLGVSEDPAVFLHNNNIWALYNNARTELEQKRAVLYQQMLTSGYTMDTRKQMSALSAWWSKQINHFMLVDAGSWQGNAQFKKGSISDGQVVQQGPWTTQLEGDPFATRAFIHDVFPGINAAQLAKGTIGETVVELRKELSADRAAEGHPVATSNLGFASAQELRTRVSEISKVLAPFNGYPHDQATAVQDLYYSKFVGPYIAKRTALTNAANNAASTDANAAHDALRAWKDSHDHPVVVTYKGHQIQFPSPVRVGWATLPPAQRRQALATAIAGNWAHVASYEKDFLGVKRAPDVSEGWSVLQQVIDQYDSKPGNPPMSATTKMAAATALNKFYPGFLTDYNFSIQPKVNRFEYTDLYKTMPEKALFDEYFGNLAKTIAAKIKADGQTTYYTRVWKQYVKTMWPVLQQHPVLAREIANYGKGGGLDFLNSLVSRG